MDKLFLPKMVIKATSHCLDLAKDALLLVQISFSQGGIQALMGQPTNYIKGVSKYIFFENLGKYSEICLKLADFLYYFGLYFTPTDPKLHSATFQRT